jgi:hypothetical protein
MHAARLCTIEEGNEERRIKNKMAGGKAKATA